MSNQNDQMRSMGTPPEPDRLAIDPALAYLPDGRARHPSVAGVMKHFRFKHLPGDLQSISRRCAELAIAMANELPENPDLTCGLRELLAAKDNFVRARLP